MRQSKVNGSILRGVRRLGTQILGSPKHSLVIRPDCFAQSGVHRTMIGSCATIICLFLRDQFTLEMYTKDRSRISKQTQGNNCLNCWKARYLECGSKSYPQLRDCIRSQARCHERMMEHQFQSRRSDATDSSWLSD